jgi:type IV pilus assembly protein PilC
MALFAYTAMDARGSRVRGTLEAANKLDLEMRLKRMELDFIDGGLRKRSHVPGFGNARVPRRELINFCFHLEQLICAGVPILEGLADLRDSIEHPRFREVLAGIIESIDGGKSLSQAMQEYPQVFDEVFVSLIRAGEESGMLDEILCGLIDSLKWQDELHAHAKKLILYPAFLGMVVVAVTVFLMIYLVPKMAGFIAKMGLELPAHTKVLIAVSDALIHYWGAILAVPLLIAAGIFGVLRTNSSARQFYDQAILGLPIVGDILRKLILARFASVFAMLYASKIPIVEAIRTTEGIVGNTVIRSGLQRVGQLIVDGRKVSGAFDSVALFPPLVIRMLRIGESSGGLDRALRNVSYFYSRDVRESIERAQVMVEPAMTMIVGLLLGWVMLAMLGPIYDIIASLKT